ncbi:MAG: PadR family transcriptional regulator [Saprospiraceae bacterium]
MNKDIQKIVEKTQKQLRRGILELCVLSIISEKEAYPSDIIERLEKAKMIVVEGTLYPLLTRLKNAGLLSYNWRESTSGPPRKYFQLTEKGEEFLIELKKSWDELVIGVESILTIEAKTTEIT